MAGRSWIDDSGSDFDGGQDGKQERGGSQQLDGREQLDGGIGWSRLSACSRSCAYSIEFSRF